MGKNSAPGWNKFIFLSYTIIQRSKILKETFFRREKKDIEANAESSLIESEYLIVSRINAIRMVFRYRFPGGTNDVHEAPSFMLFTLILHLLLPIPKMMILHKLKEINTIDIH